MSSPISVDVNAMVQAAELLKTDHDSIRGQVLGLHTEFDALGASWGGNAAMQFQGAMEGFYELVNGVLTSLLTLAGQVDTAAVNYEKTHNMSTDAASSLQKQISADTPSLGLAGI